MRDYRLHLAAKNEGLYYEDESGAYRFNLARCEDTWTVTIPPTKEPELAPATFSPDEEARIYSRVTSFLSRIWWLGIWPSDYKVQFAPRKDA